MKASHRAVDDAELGPGAGSAGGRPSTPTTTDDQRAPRSPRAICGSVGADEALERARAGPRPRK